MMEEQRLSDPYSEAELDLHRRYHQAVHQWCVSVERLCHRTGHEYFEALEDVYAWKKQVASLRKQIGQRTA
jgi:hypothetical protein